MKNSANEPQFTSQVLGVEGRCDGRASFIGILLERPE